MGCARCLPMSFLKARTSKMTCNSEMICITTNRKILSSESNSRISSNSSPNISVSPNMLNACSACLVALCLPNEIGFILSRSIGCALETLEEKGLACLRSRLKVST